MALSALRQKNPFSQKKKIIRNAFIFFHVVFLQPNPLSACSGGNRPTFQPHNSSPCFFRVFLVSVAFYLLSISHLILYFP